MAALLCVVGLLAYPAVRADTTVAGTLVDLVNGNAVVAASVTVLRGGQSIGSTTSGADGSFRAFISVPVQPEAQHLVLRAQRDGYADVSRDVVVVSGRTDTDSYHLTLQPKAAVDCRQQRQHGVAVGHFRPPPTTTPHWDLVGAIRDALKYDLFQRVGQSSLRPEQQPFVWACPEAKPQIEQDYAGWAEALNADAFLAGHVVPAGARYKVEMQVVDRFSGSGMPIRSTSQDVDLIDTTAARMDRSAHSAILMALLAGYQESEQYAECVEISVAAERILGELTPDLAAIRSACQTQLANRGLLAGGSP